MLKEQAEAWIVWLKYDLQLADSIRKVNVDLIEALTNSTFYRAELVEGLSQNGPPFEITNDDPSQISMIKKTCNILNYTQTVLQEIEELEFSSERQTALSSGKLLFKHMFGILKQADHLVDLLNEADPALSQMIGPQLGVVISKMTAATSSIKNKGQEFSISMQAPDSFSNLSQSTIMSSDQCNELLANIIGSGIDIVRQSSTPKKPEKELVKSKSRNSLRILKRGKNKVKPAFDRKTFVENIHKKFNNLDKHKRQLSLKPVQVKSAGISEKFKAVMRKKISGAKATLSRSLLAKDELEIVNTVINAAIDIADPLSDDLDKIASISENVSKILREELYPTLLSQAERTEESFLLKVGTLTNPLMAQIDSLHNHIFDAIGYASNLSGVTGTIEGKTSLGKGIYKLYQNDFSQNNMYTVARDPVVQNKCQQSRMTYVSTKRKIQKNAAIALSGAEQFFELIEASESIFKSGQLYNLPAISRLKLHASLELFSPYLERFNSNIVQIITNASNITISERVEAVFQEIGDDVELYQALKESMQQEPLKWDDVIDNLGCSESQKDNLKILLNVHEAANDELRELVIQRLAEKPEQASWLSSIATTTLHGISAVAHAAFNLPNKLLAGDDFTDINGLKKRILTDIRQNIADSKFAINSVGQSRDFVRYKFLYAMNDEKIELKKKISDFDRMLGIVNGLGRGDVLPIDDLYGFFSKYNLDVDILNQPKNLRKKVMSSLSDKRESLDDELNHIYLEEENQLMNYMENTKKELEEGSSEIMDVTMLEEMVDQISKVEEIIEQDWQLLQTSHPDGKICVFAEIYPYLSEDVLNSLGEDVPSIIKKIKQDPNAFPDHLKQNILDSLDNKKTSLSAQIKNHSSNDTAIYSIPVKTTLFSRIANLKMSAQIEQIKAQYQETCQTLLSTTLKDKMIDMTMREVEDHYYDEETDVKSDPSELYKDPDSIRVYSQFEVALDSLYTGFKNLENIAHTHQSNTFSKDISETVNLASGLQELYNAYWYMNDNFQTPPFSEIIGSMNDLFHENKAELAGFIPLNNQNMPQVRNTQSQSMDLLSSWMRQQSIVDHVMHHEIIDDDRVYENEQVTAPHFDLYRFEIGKDTEVRRDEIRQLQADMEQLAAGENRINSQDVLHQEMERCKTIAKVCPLIDDKISDLRGSVVGMADNKIKLIKRLENVKCDLQIELALRSEFISNYQLSDYKKQITAYETNNRHSLLGDMYNDILNSIVEIKSFDTQSKTEILNKLKDIAAHVLIHGAEDYNKAKVGLLKMREFLGKTVVRELSETERHLGFKAGSLTQPLIEKIDHVFNNHINKSNLTGYEKYHLLTQTSIVDALIDNEQAAKYKEPEGIKVTEAIAMIQNMSFDSKDMDPNTNFYSIRENLDSSIKREIQSFFEVYEKVEPLLAKIDVSKYYRENILRSLKTPKQFKDEIKELQQNILPKLMIMMRAREANKTLFSDLKAERLDDLRAMKQERLQVIDQLKNTLREDVENGQLREKYEHLIESLCDGLPKDVLNTVNIFPDEVIDIAIQVSKEAFDKNEIPSPEAIESALKNNEHYRNLEANIEKYLEVKDDFEQVREKFQKLNLDINEFDQVDPLKIKLISTLIDIEEFMDQNPGQYSSSLSIESVLNSVQISNGIVEINLDTVQNLFDQLKDENQNKIEPSKSSKRPVMGSLKKAFQSISKSKRKSWPKGYVKCNKNIEQAKDLLDQIQRANLCENLNPRHIRSASG